MPFKDDKKDGVNNITTGFNTKMNMDQKIATKQPSATSKTTATTKNINKNRIDVTTISTVEKFQCRPDDIYNALTRSEMMTAFTRAYVKMDAVKGGEFSLFGGNITGKIQELVENQKIVKQWRYKPWPEGHYSIVTITIIQKVCVSTKCE